MDTIKWNILCMCYGSSEEDRRNREKSIFEAVMAETSKSEREMGIQIQKAQRTATMIKAKKSTLKHITVNLSKAKRILKTAREKQLIVKIGNSYNSINRYLSKLITGQNGVG